MTCWAVLLSLLLAVPTGSAGHPGTVGRNATNPSAGPVSPPLANARFDTPAAMVPFPTARGFGHQGAAQAPPDRWFAEDKLRHFAMSFAATGMTYAAARFALPPDEAVQVAGATALLLGIGKEVADVRAGGPFSLKDLAWDAAGVALGVALARRTR